MQWPYDREVWPAIRAFRSSLGLSSGLGLLVLSGTELRTRISSGAATADHGRMKRARPLSKEWSCPMYEQAHESASSIDGQLFEAARKGDVARLASLLDAHPEKLHARAKGDNTYAMHWAAAGGHRDVVERLADAGGDVVGRGDDHELEVIGWGTS